MSKLRVHYGRMLAVSDVSLRVGQGELVAMVGANGAGKSTTLRAISGLARADGGTIRLDGEPIGHLPPHAIARRGVAHVPEGRGLLPGLTVAENLRLGTFIRSATAGLAAETERVMTYFPALRRRQADRAAVLSGGEQQMLSISRALMGQPRLLMIDEMSLGLAPRLTQMILEVVVDLTRNGLAVLCVEQNVKLVLRHASRAYVVRTGQTVMEGTGSGLLADASLVDLYLGRAAPRLVV